MTGALPTWFYEESEGVFTPSVLALGPWDRRWQNGVALAGLVAHLWERAPAPVAMVPARLTLDILRPTPMGPISARVTPLREGRKLQLLEVELLADGVPTIRATALRVREAEAPALAEAIHPLAPEGLPTLNGKRSRFGHIIETRLESGGLEVLGPGVVWARFLGEIVRGMRISPLVTAAMVADFGSGLSSVMDWREWSFANVDISLHLARMPRSEWIRVAARTASSGNGIGVVATSLADLNGDIGHAHQTLFFDRTSS
ncbi:thioesterase family protein [Novosphingobium taihuense]|uniref:Thioesterase superfamily protein n=1 Tax=Novosphingobium taihuense TaxID=260085 RepID=A0A7W7AG62_9SPHN|nr:thioesterase family protein [Novosphingobium taihuense]MBB4615417.1 hypothetical protein [Novosphingobium taihuense]TWH82135.1 thioesterase superfamily protein [Novosphingobium taihuense]